MITRGENKDFLRTFLPPSARTTRSAHAHATAAHAAATAAHATAAAAAAVAATALTTASMAISLDDDDVDIPKLLLVGSGAYTCLTATLHPLSVIKTRAQAVSSSAHTSRIELIRGMIAASGVRGLWAGVVPVLAGALPARAAYIVALEGVRPRAAAGARSLGLTGVQVDAVAHGCAGLAAAAASMLIYVPVDVVSQRLMMYGDPAVAAARGMDVTARPSFSREVRSIVETSGVRGLFRGLGISLAIGLPAGSIWWGAYGSARATLGRMPELCATPDLALKGAAGTFAAFCTCAAVAPLDTIKTHVQLSTTGTESAWRLATRLLRKDGLLSLYAGFGPRFVHLSIWGSCLITIYEELKRVCKKTPPQSLLVRTLTGSSPGLPGPQLSGR